MISLTIGLFWEAVQMLNHEIIAEKIKQLPSNFLQATDYQKEPSLMNQTINFTPDLFTVGKILPKSNYAPLQIVPFESVYGSPSKIYSKLTNKSAPTSEELTDDEKFARLLSIAYNKGQSSASLMKKEVKVLNPSGESGKYQKFSRNDLKLLPSIKNSSLKGSGIEPPSSMSLSPEKTKGSLRQKSIKNIETIQAVEMAGVRGLFPESSNPSVMAQLKSNLNLISKKGISMGTRQAREPSSLMLQKNSHNSRTRSADVDILSEAIAENSSIISTKEKTPSPGLNPNPAWMNEIDFIRKLPTIKSSQRSKSNIANAPGSRRPTLIGAKNILSSQDTDESPNALSAYKRINTSFDQIIEKRQPEISPYLAKYANNIIMSKINRIGASAQRGKSPYAAYQILANN